MRARLAEATEALRDRLISTDPGLNRLRTAVKAVVGVGSTIGIEHLFSPLSGESSIIAMMLGAIVGMLASMGVNDPSPRGKAVTLAWFPVAISPGLVLGALLGSHRLPSLVVFVAVMFAAVWVRRFGMRFFMYGMLAWMGYFLADLLGSTVSQYPHLLSIVAVAVAWSVILDLTLFRDHPDRQLRATGQALVLRVHDVAAAAAAVLDRPGDDRALRSLRRQTARVREAGLMVDAQLAVPGAVPPGWSRGRLRLAVVDLEVGIQDVALAAVRISRPDVSRAEGAGGGPPQAVRDAALEQLRALQSRSAQPPAAGTVWEAPATAGLPAGETPARRQLDSLVRAVAQVQATSTHWSGSRADGEEAEDELFEPAVTLVGGSLPGSAATVREMLSATAEQRGSLWARLSLTTRQAVQVALATGLAIIAGDALSGSRYYWAAIAAFVAFSGTSTTAETFGKAANRVVGTLVGLVASVAVAEGTAGHTAVAIIVILVCVGLGFYLNKVSYALMIFFITIMVGQLYSLLHEFSAGLLVLRLEETAIGAGIGVAVTLVVLPVSTHVTARAARAAFVGSLHDLLEAVATRLDDGPAGPDLIGPSRELDAKLQQLVLVAEPLTRSLYFGGREDARLALRALQACDFFARGLALAVERAAAPEGRGTNGSGADAPSLPQACRTLAGACEVLGGDGNEEARARAATAAHDVADRLSAPPLADHPAARYLVQLSGLVALLVDPHHDQPSSTAAGATHEALPAGGPRQG